MALVLAAISVAGWLLYQTFFVKTSVVSIFTDVLVFLTAPCIVSSKWQPDLVCVTGDLTQHHGQLEKVMREIAKIKMKDRIFFVPGNYEREERRGFRCSPNLCQFVKIRSQDPIYWTLIVQYNGNIKNQTRF